MTGKTKRNTKTWYLRPETITRLKNHGKFGETQDDLINRLIDNLEECEKKAAQKV